MTRKLNRQYEFQLAVTKTRFFPWYVATKCDTHNENSIFGVDSSSYPISLMLHDCITYDINIIILWWMGVAKSRYQFISSAWGFFSPLGLFQLLAILVFSRFLTTYEQNTYFVELLSMAAYHNILRKNNMAFFDKFWPP